MEKVMLRPFPKHGGTAYERAAHIYTVLCYWVDWRMSDSRIEKEHRSEGLISYGGLAIRLGLEVGASGTFSVALGHVARYCAINDLPALNSVVVNAKTGLPGDGVLLADYESAKREFQAVKAYSGEEEYRWTAIRSPSPTHFRKAHQQYSDPDA
ncbi:MAG: hypothetical protein ACU0BF_07075 [Paracoccaceae bacterium]